ncbi:hypothetical protein THASP1DRAFT_34019 [Thamnocephalis sphaerospora]|uniref:COP9 signalosome complex subunit 4 n=1 Tax=Thamnocephalis sphaerospora TaxID=78915 RepID=A0A4P9XYK1_9FUNG|nr:hypothetical protein THASP1DRAFT_34019 [Thamnocephalis sphaerospora]|eukprot:RKP10781.1 hypothetical protein THASP1DRAFT_34019 [Thamnocephalis sphaerospora]
MNVSAKLQQLASQGHPAEGYGQLFDTLLADPASLSPASAALRPALDAVLREQVGLVISRQVLEQLLHSVDQVASQGDAGHTTAKLVLQEAVEAMTPRAVSFEEQASALAAIFEDEEDWRQAARALQAIPLESGHRAVSADYQLKTYIHIVRLMLAEDDAIEAEAYLNRAALLIHDNGDEEDKLHFKLSQARVLDAKRRFIDASMKYHQISYATNVEEEELVCAVLSPAGPQRSRVLATLYKDERTSGLDGLFSMLEKVYLDRLLEPEDINSFSMHLSEHHQARLADNSTVLDRAILEHNLLSVSRLYDCIRVGDLARFLNVAEDRAERVAARMMGEGRMRGSIDQVERLIAGGDAGAHVASIHSSSTHIFSRWDEKLQSLCAQVEDIAGVIAEHHPDLSKGQVA